jgi:hypothetical protein
MRPLLIATLVSCVPSAVRQLASDRLGAHDKVIHLADHDRADGLDIYTFCKPEHAWLERHYDGACVTLVCPAGDGGSRCR